MLIRNKIVLDLLKALTIEKALVCFLFPLEFLLAYPMILSYDSKKKKKKTTKKNKVY